MTIWRDGCMEEVSQPAQGNNGANDSVSPAAALTWYRLDDGATVELDRGKNCGCGEGGGVGFPIYL